MKPVDLAILTASIKKEIELTVPQATGRITFRLQMVDPDKRMAKKYAHELRRKNPGKIVVVKERKLRYAKTSAIYMSLL